LNPKPYTPSFLQCEARRRTEPGTLPRCRCLVALCRDRKVNGETHAQGLPKERRRRGCGVRMQPHLGSKYVLEVYYVGF